MNRLLKVGIRSFAVVCAGLALCSPVLATAFETNGLWLEMALTNSTAQTNYFVRTNHNVVRTNQYIALTYHAAAFVIHPPETNAEGKYDLYQRTNILDACDWTWLKRNFPGKTNFVVSNIPPANAFYRLSVTNAVRPGNYTNVLAANDDGSTELVPIGFSINFYGSSNDALYVNNNGDVTFDSPVSEYTPKTLVTLGVEVIAPFWADVDTRNPASDVVRYGNSTVDGHNAFIVDWVNVGYYNDKADKLLSCQLVLINRSDITPGDFDMEFNYDKVEWQWGDVTQNDPPRAGFANNGGGYELPGSGIDGAFMDTNEVSGLIYYNASSSVPGRYFFRFRDGQPQF
jgi:hypothetical protein